MPEVNYYVRKAPSVVSGPFPAPVVRSMALGGRLLRQDAVAVSPHGPWTTADQVPQLVFKPDDGGVIHVPAPGLVQPSAASASEESRGSGAIRSAPAPAGAEDRVRAALLNLLQTDAKVPFPYTGSAMFTHGLWGTAIYFAVMRWLEPRNCRRRLTYDIYVGHQVQASMVANAHKVFEDFDPTATPVLAALREFPGEDSCAYVTSTHLLFRAYKMDTAAGQMRAAATGLGFNVEEIPLHTITSVVVDRPTGILARSMRIKINGADLGGIFAGDVTENAQCLQRVIEVAARAARE